MHALIASVNRSISSVHCDTHKPIQRIVGCRASSENRLRTGGGQRLHECAGCNSSVPPSIRPLRKVLLAEEHEWHTTASVDVVGVVDVLGVQGLVDANFRFAQMRQRIWVELGG